MKCPYMDFKECIVQGCPSCNYNEIKHTEIDGRFPTYMSIEDAIKEGYAYEVERIRYEFVSCRLVENNVQPVPSKKEIINNTNQTKTNVVIHRSIF